MWQNESNATWNAQQHITTSHTAPAVRDSSVELDHIFHGETVFWFFSLMCSGCSASTLCELQSFLKASCCWMFGCQRSCQRTWTGSARLDRAVAGSTLRTGANVSGSGYVCLSFSQRLCELKLKLKLNLNLFSRWNNVVMCWVLFVVSM